MSLEPAEGHPARIATCPICASNRLYYVFSTDACRVARCDDCGLLAASATWDEATSTEVAGPAEIRTAMATLGTVWPSGMVEEWLHRYRGATGGRLLLVGRTHQAFVDHAISAGFDVTLVDDERDGRASIGSTSSYARIEDVPSHTTTFDVVILDGALNDTSQPVALLQHAHARLAERGVLLATVPKVTPMPVGASPTTVMAPIRPGCFAFASNTLQSVLFQCGFREIVRLPGTRGVRTASTGGACAVIARRATPRPRPVVSIVLPAFNEAATVGTTLDRVIAKHIPGVDFEIVIVESNSSDGTREIVKSYAGRDRVRVILEDRPRGKGYAVRTGLREATGDFILIQDADCEYDIDDYDVLLEPLLSGREAFVLGARHGGQTWKIRQFNDQPLQALLLNLAHGVFTGMINVSLGLSLKDPFTMYKVFRRDCLHGLTFECNRFDFDWELLIKLVRRGHLPLEIPVNYRSRSFKEGKKVSVIRDPITWIVALFRSLSARIDLLNAPDSESSRPSSGSAGSPN